MLVFVLLFVIALAIVFFEHKTGYFKAASQDEFFWGIVVGALIVIGLLTANPTWLPACRQLTSH